MFADCHNQNFRPLLPILCQFDPHTPENPKTSSHMIDFDTDVPLVFYFFYVLLTVHPGMILANNQICTQFFIYVYFYTVHVSGSYVPIIGRIIVSMRHVVYVTAYLHTRRSPTQSDINQVSHWYNNSPDDGHMAAPKHVENRIKHTLKIVRQVGYLQEKKFH